jgi:hypothetical protein
MKQYILIFLLCTPFYSAAQLERELDNPNAKEELTFHAPRHINLFTVEPLSKRELHFAIMHTFNSIDNGVRNLWGLDNGANIRLSFEYGISNRFSAGFGRSSLDKVYDFFGRYHIIQQSQNGKIPLSVSLMANMAINTSDYSFLPAPGIEAFSRRNYALQLMLARKFGDRFSLQVSPMAAFFEQMEEIFAVEGNTNVYYALAFSGKLKLTPRTSLTGQWIPNLNTSLRNNLGIGIDVEAGGHVFQMYFVSSPALTESYLLAGGNGELPEKFRLGFNVNRVFGIGKFR